MVRLNNIWYAICNVGKEGGGVGGPFMPYANSHMRTAKVLMPNANSEVLIPHANSVGPYAKCEQ